MTITLEQRLETLIETEFIESGDTVSYICDDTGERRVGIYMTLWLYANQERITKHLAWLNKQAMTEKERGEYAQNLLIAWGETSPNVGDNRVMAKIYTGTGVTYADTTTIRKALKV